MDLKTYLKKLKAEERRALAAKAGTTPEYLDQLKGGWRRPSPELAMKLVAASHNAVKLSDLRPDIWGQQ